MYNLSNTITISQSEYRVCIVDGKNALFHTWEIKRQIIEPSLMQGGHNGGTVQATLAIVEFEDGTIEEVYPYRIKFLDNKLKEYCFNNGE